MEDISFDITIREIQFVDGTPASDFLLTGNPSVQNGGNVLLSRGANPLLPMFGIDVLQVIGGPASVLTTQMNRWKNQAILDGATLAKWSVASNNPQLPVAISVSYE